MERILRLSSTSVSMNICISRTGSWKNSWRLEVIRIGAQTTSRADPRNIDEFREVMPLTDYYDYSEVLLARNSDMLPGEPIILIQTTWEGGFRPIKSLPTQGKCLIHIT
jgi:hypothetical protein